MSFAKKIGKREFIQHTSKHLKWVEEHGTPLLVTHHGKPQLELKKVKLSSFKDLRGSVQVKILGDINEPVLPEYGEW